MIYLEMEDPDSSLKKKKSSNNLCKNPQAPDFWPDLYSDLQGHVMRKYKTKSQAIRKYVILMET